MHVAPLRFPLSDVLLGGYHDAGDNVKFGFPLAYSMTVLAWSIIEYRGQLAQANQLQYAMDALKWGTDYIILCHPEPNLYWSMVCNHSDLWDICFPEG